MIRFTKAHACGNDFLIVESAEVAGRDLSAMARRMCARNTGVGADGVEFFTAAEEHGGRIRLHNADGSMAEISGNGTRCVAAWIAQRNQLGPGARIALETDAGMRECRIEGTEARRFRISSAMGVPQVKAGVVRLSGGAEIGNQKIEGVVVSTGNPHFVIFVEADGFTCGGRAWEEVGHEICHHASFPEQTNVEFVRVLAPDRLEIRIFERGVGPTSSSGTGTSAAAAAAMTMRGAARSVEVIAPGGAQRVDWPDAHAPLVLTGPAELIATGEYFDTDEISNGDEG